MPAFPLAVWAVLTGILPPPSPCTNLCTCRNPGGPREELSTAAAVLEGVAGRQRPYGIRSRSGASTVTRVLVERVWKGAVADTLYVFSGSPGGTDCGYEFIDGVRYLLYLYREPEGRWAITICSLSAPSSSARDQMSVLGPPQRLVQQGSHVVSP